METETIIPIVWNGKIPPELVGVPISLREIQKVEEFNSVCGILVVIHKNMLGMPKYRGIGRNSQGMWIRFRGRKILMSEDVDSASIMLKNEGLLRD